MEAVGDKSDSSREEIRGSKSLLEELKAPSPSESCSRLHSFALGTVFGSVPGLKVVEPVGSSSSPLEQRLGLLFFPLSLEGETTNEFLFGGRTKT